MNRGLSRPSDPTFFSNTMPAIDQSLKIAVPVGSPGEDGKKRGCDGRRGFSVRDLSLTFAGGSVQTKPKIRIDPMNVRILNILQQDGRATTAEIARRMKRAESTVKERIGLMEEAGVIKGYTAVVDKRAF